MKIDINNDGILYYWNGQSISAPYGSTITVFHEEEGVPAAIHGELLQGHLKGSAEEGAEDNYVYGDNYIDVAIDLDNYYSIPAGAIQDLVVTIDYSDEYDLEFDETKYLN